MGDLSPWHLLIIAAVILVLFGSAKLPRLAKSLGESMRIFKSETQKLHEENNKTTAAVQQPFVQQELPPQQPPVSQPVQDTAPPAAAQVPGASVPGTQHTNQAG
jgi:sec-independent protein translocase protein TatA